MQNALSLDNLTEDEQASIWKVLQRDDRLRQDQNVKVHKLKGEIYHLRMKGVLRDGDDLSRLCIRCHCQLGLIFNKGEICPSCRFKICRTCRVALLTGGWTCIYCFKQMQLKWLSGDWIHPQVSIPNLNRRLSGSDLVRTAFFMPEESGNAGKAVTEELRRVITNGSEPASSEDLERTSSFESSSIGASTLHDSEVERVGFPTESDSFRLSRLISSYTNKPVSGERERICIKRASSRPYRDSDSDSSSSAATSPVLSTGRQSHARSTPSLNTAVTPDHGSKKDIRTSQKSSESRREPSPVASERALGRQISNSSGQSMSPPDPSESGQKERRTSPRSGTLSNANSKTRLLDLAAYHLSSSKKNLSVSTDSGQTPLSAHGDTGSEMEFFEQSQSSGSRTKLSSDTSDAEAPIDSYFTDHLSKEEEIQQSKYSGHVYCSHPFFIDPKTEDLTPKFDEPSDPKELGSFVGLAEADQFNMGKGETGLFKAEKHKIMDKEIVCPKEGPDLVLSKFGCEMCPSFTYRRQEEDTFLMDQNEMYSEGFCVDPDIHSNQPQDQIEEFAKTAIEPGIHSNQPQDQIEEFAKTAIEPGIHFNQPQDQIEEFAKTAIEPGIHSDQSQDQIEEFAKTAIEPGIHFNQPQDQTEEFAKTEIEPEFNSNQAQDQPEDFFETAIQPYFDFNQPEGETGDLLETAIQPFFNSNQPKDGMGDSSKTAIEPDLDFDQPKEEMGDLLETAIEPDLDFDQHKDQLKYFPQTVDQTFDPVHCKIQKTSIECSNPQVTSLDSTQDPNKCNLIKTTAFNPTDSKCSTIDLSSYLNDSKDLQKTPVLDPSKRSEQWNNPQRLELGSKFDPSHCDNSQNIFFDSTLNPSQCKSQNSTKINLIERHLSLNSKPDLEYKCAEHEPTLDSLKDSRFRSLELGSVTQTKNMDQIRNIDSSVKTDLVDLEDLNLTKDLRFQEKGDNPQLVQNDLRFDISESVDPQGKNLKTMQRLETLQLKNNIENDKIQPGFDPYVNQKGENFNKTKNQKIPESFTEAENDKIEPGFDPYNNQQDENLDNTKNPKIPESFIEAENDKIEPGFDPYVSENQQVENLNKTKNQKIPESFIEAQNDKIEPGFDPYNNQQDENLDNTKNPKIPESFIEAQNDKIEPGFDPYNNQQGENLDNTKNPKIPESFIEPVDLPVPEKNRNLHTKKEHRRNTPPKKRTGTYRFLVKSDSSLDHSSNQIRSRPNISDPESSPNQQKYQSKKTKHRTCPNLLEPESSQNRQQNLSKKTENQICSKIIESETSQNFQKNPPKNTENQICPKVLDLELSQNQHRNPPKNTENQICPKVLDLEWSQNQHRNPPKNTENQICPKVLDLELSQNQQQNPYKNTENQICPKVLDLELSQNQQQNPYKDTENRICLNFLEPESSQNQHQIPSKNTEYKILEPGPIINPMPKEFDSSGKMRSEQNTSEIQNCRISIEKVINPDCVSNVEAAFEVSESSLNDLIHLSTIQTQPVRKPITIDPLLEHGSTQAEISQEITEIKRIREPLEFTADKSQFSDDLSSDSNQTFNADDPRVTNLSSNTNQSFTVVDPRIAESSPNMNKTFEDDPRIAESRSNTNQTFDTDDPIFPESSFNTNQTFNADDPIFPESSSNTNQTFNADDHRIADLSSDTKWFREEKHNENSRIISFKHDPLKEMFYSPNGSVSSPFDPVFSDASSVILNPNNNSSKSSVFEQTEVSNLDQNQKSNCLKFQTKTESNIFFSTDTKIENPSSEFEPNPVKTEQLEPNLSLFPKATQLSHRTVNEKNEATCNADTSLKFAHSKINNNTDFSVTQLSPKHQNDSKMDFSEPGLSKEKFFYKSQAQESRDQTEKNKEEPLVPAARKTDCHKIEDRNKSSDEGQFKEDQEFEDPYMPLFNDALDIQKVYLSSKDLSSDLSPDSGKLQINFEHHGSVDERSVLNQTFSEENPFDKEFESFYNPTSLAEDNETLSPVSDTSLSEYSFLEAYPANELCPVEGEAGFCKGFPIVPNSGLVRYSRHFLEAIPEQASEDLNEEETDTASLEEAPALLDENGSPGFGSSGNHFHETDDNVIDIGFKRVTYSVIKDEDIDEEFWGRNPFSVEPRLAPVVSETGSRSLPEMNDRMYSSGKCLETDIDSVLEFHPVNIVTASSNTLLSSTTTTSNTSTTTTTTTSTKSFQTTPSSSSDLNNRPSKLDLGSTFASLMESPMDSKSPCESGSSDFSLLEYSPGTFATPLSLDSDLSPMSPMKDGGVVPFGSLRDMILEDERLALERALMYCPLPGNKDVTETPKQFDQNISNVSPAFENPWQGHQERPGFQDGIPGNDPFDSGLKSSVMLDPSPVIQLPKPNLLFPDRSKNVPHPSGIMDCPSPIDASPSPIKDMPFAHLIEHQSLQNPGGEGRRMGSQRSTEDALSQSRTYSGGGGVRDDLSDSSSLHTTSGHWPNGNRHRTDLDASLPSITISEAEGTVSVRHEMEEENNDFLQGSQSVRSGQSVTSNLGITSSMGSRDSLSSYYSNAGEVNYGQINVTGEIQFGLDYDYKTVCLEIRIKQCRDLAPADLKKHRSDPYVKSYLLPDKSKTGKRKTKVKKNTLNPVYDEILRYSIVKSELENRTLWLTVWNSDRFGRNDFLGEVTIPFDYYRFEGPTLKWYPLQQRQEFTSSSLAYKGELTISLKYMTVDGVLTSSTTSLRHSRGGSRSPDGGGGGSGGQLHVFIKEARNLTAVRSGGYSDPFCKGYLLPEKHRTSKQKTPVVKKDCNPVWNYSFVFEDVSASELSDRCLELTLWDYDRLSSNDFLGGIRLNLGSGICGRKYVDWMDASGAEVSLWQSMISYPNTWVDGTLLLRSNMNHRK